MKRKTVPMKKRLILIGFLALLLGVGALVYRGQREERLTGLYYSGTIEATLANRWLKRDSCWQYWNGKNSVRGGIRPSLT